MQLLGMRMPHLIEPRLVVESDRIHDQRVPVLVRPCRMPPPLRIDVRGMLGIEPDDTERRTELVQDVHRFLSLYEPGLDRPQVDVRNTGRLAVDDLRVCRL